MGQDEGGLWDEVFLWGDTERTVTNENGEDVKKMVNKENVYWEIQQCFKNGKEVRTGNFPAGIWLGGRKYTLTQQDVTTTEPNIPFVNLAEKAEGKPGAGGGATITYYGGYIVCGFFKKPTQDSGNCNIAVTAYAPVAAGE